MYLKCLTPSARNVLKIIAPIADEKGFVLAGRSLREVEIRVSNIEKISGIAMLAIWAATLFLVAFSEIVSKKEYYVKIS